MKIAGLRQTRSGALGIWDCQVQIPYPLRGWPFTSLRPLLCRQDGIPSLDLHDSMCVDWGEQHSPENIHQITWSHLGPWNQSKGKKENNLPEEAMPVSCPYTSPENGFRGTACLQPSSPT